ncbi:hypothetical protein TNCV_1673701 [Trichonephila clavipes]|nr:hypothetical protein TNCV_1673701 [Trichonephila clavipes]
MGGFEDEAGTCIASKASSGEFLLQSQKQLKVTWCEIRTMILALPVKSCNMVLRCRQRVWSRIVIQQQKARFEKPGHFFRIFPFNFDRVSQYCVALMVSPPKSPHKIKRFLRMQSPEFFLEDFLKLIKRYDKYLNVLGTYVEK